MGLFIKSSCNNCLNPFKQLRFYNFYTLFAPNIKVCIWRDPCKYWRCYPGIELKTKSSLIKAGKLGKFSNDTIPQSFNVSIWRYLYLYSSDLTSGVKYPPNFTDTISITYTKWGGVSPIWSRIALINLRLSGLLGIVEEGTDEGKVLAENPNILLLFNFITKTLFFEYYNNSDKN